MVQFEFCLKILFWIRATIILFLITARVGRSSSSRINQISTVSAVASTSIIPCWQMRDTKDKYSPPPTHTYKRKSHRCKRYIFSTAYFAQEILLCSFYMQQSIPSVPTFILVFLISLPFLEVCLQGKTFSLI